jgi:hypothetical protein
VKDRQGGIVQGRQVGKAIEKARILLAEPVVVAKGLAHLAAIVAPGGEIDREPAGDFGGRSVRRQLSEIGSVGETVGRGLASLHVRLGHAGLARDGEDVRSGGDFALKDIDKEAAIGPIAEAVHELRC